MDKRLGVLHAGRAAGIGGQTAQKPPRPMHPPGKPPASSGLAWLGEMGLMICVKLKIFEEANEDEVLSFHSRKW